VWGDTALATNPSPSISWKNVFTGEMVAGGEPNGSVLVAEALATFPVGLFVAVPQVLTHVTAPQQ
jgi:hypothetical protein